VPRGGTFDTSGHHAEAVDDRFLVLHPGDLELHFMQRTDQLANTVTILGLRRLRHLALKLDALAPVYHKFDGTGDLKGLLEAVKSAVGTLNDLALITGFFDADWAKAAASVGVPAFRLGGDHRGGWAMVGEDGPELAYLPPARIYTASTTRRMLADSAESGTTTSTAAPVASTGESKTEALLARVAQVLEDSFEGNGLRTIPA